jgi:hypothetical protein
MNTSSNKTWTFGIVSSNINVESGDNQFYLNSVLTSIEELGIAQDDYEIIVVGSNSRNSDYEDKNIRYINFNEHIREKWITKKKNLIIENARYENIVIVHDYVSFDSDWYNGFLEFETEWDVCMCKIYNNDGVRWRDWVLWWCGTAPYRIESNGVLLHPNRLLYDDTRFVNSEMYISGSVIIGKKKYLIDNKLDENLLWGQGEDCEWSARCRPSWVYKMNTKSKLRLLKQKENT